MRFHWREVLMCLAVICLPLTLRAQEVAKPTGPERWEKEIQKFEMADKKNPPHSGCVVFVGSSSVRLWKLEDSFPGLDALNRGFGGSYLSDTVFFFDRIVKPYKPRTVVVYAGDNDLAHGSNPQDVARSFHQLMEKMQKSLPTSRLLFIGVKPSIKRWNLIEQVRETNRLIQAECQTSKQARFIDIDAPFMGADGKPNPELFVKDGLHMSEAGYKIWNDLIRNEITGDARLGPPRLLYDPYHSWTPPATLAEWERVSQSMRQRIMMATGLWPMPAKTELQPVVHGKIDMGDYTVEKVYFASMPGLYCTGSLYRPKNIEGRIPGVLCVHGHAQDGRFNENPESVAAREIASGAEQFRSGARHYSQARAVQLVRMGTVVFFYDMVGIADSGPLAHRGGFSDANAALWLHNKMGLQTWNSIRACDFLTSLPDVDPQRIGVTGESGGGTQTFLLCAVDPRPKVAFPAVMVSTGMQGGCICENADLLRVGINNIAIAALMAPRPLAVSSANDWTIDIETRGLPELKQVYSLYGQTDLVAGKCFPQFPHNFNQISREMMYDWFNTHLELGLTAPVKQQDYWPLTREQQSVFDAQHPRPADALTEAPLREKLRARDQAQFDALLAGPFEQYAAVVKPAIDVMLPHESPEKAVEESLSKVSGTNCVQESYLIRIHQEQVPVTVITPLQPTGKVVVWLDGAGRNHLLTADGKLTPEVKQLVEAGFAVASADLLLTGSTAGSVNPLLEKMKIISGSHEATHPGEDYTGFVYGYNLTLLAERAVDIDRLLQSLKSRGLEQVTLVGTGEAGLWTLLARARWSEKEVVKTIVDLQGFRFGAIESSLDTNILPGARKFGGVGGLAAVVAPASLAIFGTGDVSDQEFAPLNAVYQKQSTLKLDQAPLRRDQVSSLVLAP